MGLHRPPVLPVEFGRRAVVDVPAQLQLDVLPGDGTMDEEARHRAVLQFFSSSCLTPANSSDSQVNSAFVSRFMTLGLSPGLGNGWSASSTQFQSAMCSAT